MSLPPFQSLQKSHGAVFTKDVADSIRTIEFGPDGFPVVPSFEPLGSPDEAIHYGSPQKEYQKATTKTVVFDLSHRGHLELVGADRQKFLNGFCTADVVNLKPGEGCEAFVTNIKGKVVGHVFIFADEDSLWLETVLDSVQPLMEHLTHYIISEDVDLLPRNEVVTELYLSGPTADATLAELGLDVAGLPLYGNLHGTLGDYPVHVRRVDWLDAPGYQLCVSQDNLAACWEQLVKADISPAGIAVFHALRIQAGLPLYGIDITDDNLAQEVARTEQAINFKKGCYLGQEPIARIDAMGHVNQELRAIKLFSSAAPNVCGTIHDAEKKSIGRITSYAMLPDEYVPIALGYLHRNHLKPGTVVFVECEDEIVKGEVL